MSGFERGLEILSVLGNDEALERGGLGVVRVAELVGWQKSSVSRALKALAEGGWVERDGRTRSYRLGWRLFALSARAGDARLVDAARPVLRSLVAKLGETAHLSVLEGTGVLTVLSEAPAQAVRATGWVGRRVPASCTSTGRVLLSDSSTLELCQLFGEASLPAGGPNAPSSVEELVDRMTEDSRRGYAMAREELEVGLVAVAAPVRDGRGVVLAALSVSGPAFRLGHHLERAGQAVERAAHELSASLGHPDVKAVKAVPR